MSSPKVAETFSIEDLSKETGKAPYLRMIAKLFAASPPSALPIDIAAVPPVIPTVGSTSKAIPGAETTSPSRTIANLRCSPFSLANFLVKSVNKDADSSLNSKDTIHSFSGKTAIASAISLPVSSAGPSLYITGYPELTDKMYDSNSGLSAIETPITSSTPVIPSFTTVVTSSGSSGLTIKSRAGEYPVFKDESKTGLNVKRPVVPKASIAFS